MIKRDLVQTIKKSASYFPVVAIVGPRQSGKTTLAQHIFNKHIYLSLEDPDLRAAAHNDPRTFLQANLSEFGMIIDEFQYVPELLSYIQTIADKEQKSGYFVLTGSQNFLMNEAITQSLAGRVAIHTLLPLSFTELKHNSLLPAEVETVLFQGCYPALYAKNIPPTTLYKNYLQTYIERDVRLMAHVGDLTTFQTFITLCAARAGQLLNLTSLANDCGISDSTAKRWLSVLESSYIIFLLRPYFQNYGKRLVKTPKIYFYDTGLLCYLLKINHADLATHPNRANIFESAIISDFFKLEYNKDTTPSLYFWRDKTGHEIDCIFAQGERLVPIEIKASRTANLRFFESLEYWNSLSGNKPDNGYLVYAGSATQPKTHPHLVSWQSLDQIFEK